MSGPGEDPFEHFLNDFLTTEGEIADISKTEESKSRVQNCFKTHSGSSVYGGPELELKELWKWSKHAELVKAGSTTALLQHTDFVNSHRL